MALRNNTSGGRIRFRTNSPYIAVKSLPKEYGLYGNLTIIATNGFDLYRYENGEPVYKGTFIPPFDTRQEGFEGKIDLDGEEYEYLLYFPIYSGVEHLYIGIKEGSTLKEGGGYSYDKPVLYLGSSITQGGCASKPSNAFAAMIERRTDCDFINLGFSGSCRGEKAMADYVASLDPAVFVLDYDHNAFDPAELEATHEPLFKTFRAKHPLTPVIFATRPDFRRDPEDAAKRREIILKTYNNALASGDKNVWFIDTKTIFEPEWLNSILVDNVHPGDLGMMFMARAYGKAVEEALSRSIELGLTKKVKLKNGG